MTEKEIQKILFKKYLGFEYEFINEYFFENGNESDYIGFTSSGLCFELEIKTNKQDFKKDFEKNRHRIYESKSKGKTTYVKRLSSERIFFPDWDICRTHSEFIESSGNSKYLNFSINTYSNIDIIEIKKEMIPNKFYFCVPEFLINENDIPDYAGLIYITRDKDIQVIKEPDFLHNESFDVKTLFNKTYKYYKMHKDSDLLYV